MPVGGERCPLAAGWGFVVHGQRPLEANGARWRRSCLAIMQLHASRAESWEALSIIHVFCVSMSCLIEFVNSVEYAGKTVEWDTQVVALLQSQDVTVIK